MKNEFIRFERFQRSDPRYLSKVCQYVHKNVKHWKILEVMSNSVTIGNISHLILFLVGALSFEGKMPDYSSDLFLVGALSFQGKMPDYSSDLFFLQTTILTLIGPLFRNNPETI